MLKFNLDNHSLEQYKTTQLGFEKIKEKYDLQKAIVNSWSEFRKEINLPTAFLIGQEVQPHESIKDSIDLLAFSPEDSCLIIIELKRGKNKYQLLQSLSYAAMVNTLSTEDIIERIQPNLNPDPTELKDLLLGLDSTPDIRIILIAEDYDPEVILTSDWLCSIASIEIIAYSIRIHKDCGNLLLEVNQQYPLKALSDLFNNRGRKKRVSDKSKMVEWQDVIPKLKYDFAEEAINLCQKLVAGEPARRRFGLIRKGWEGFSWITVNMRQDYINVYISGQFDGDEESIYSVFGSDIELNRWKGGLSFLVRERPQFDILIKWLKLKD